MKITVFAAGSRGDIQPCVVLSRGLQQAGYRVRLAAPEDFAGFIQAHGVDHYPLRGDVRQIMAGDTGREFMETGGANPIKSILAVRKMIAPIVMTCKRWRLNDGKREFDLVELVRDEIARRSGPASRGRWA